MIGLDIRVRYAISDDGDFKWDRADILGVIFFQIVYLFKSNYLSVFIFFDYHAITYFFVDAGFRLLEPYIESISDFIECYRYFFHTASPSFILSVIYAVTIKPWLFKCLA